MTYGLRPFHSILVIQSQWNVEYKSLSATEPCMRSLELPVTEMLKNSYSFLVEGAAECQRPNV